MDTAADKGRIERWLRATESRVLPLWINALRRQDRPRVPGDTTKELQRHVFFLYYDRLCQALLDDNTDSLEQMLRTLVTDHLRQNYDIKQILQFPLKLKSILWRQLSQSLSAKEAQATMDCLDPLLDYSTGVLVEAYAQVNEAALNDQLQGLDFLTQRLALASEETEQAFTQLHSLYSISKTISSTLDIHKTLEAIADNLVAIPDIECCTIWLVTPQDTLEVGVTRGQTGTTISDVVLPMQKASSFVTRALLARNQQEFEGRSDALSSFLAGRRATAIPMVNEDRPVGVVVINGVLGGKPFDASTISVIRAATEQAAIALENAQLYDRLARFNQELEETVRQRTTEIKRTNEELERVNLDLERLDRTKSDFINIAAHELKTPLTLIQGYASIIRDDKTVSTNPFLVNILNGLMKGSERLHSIIESMIDVSVIDSQVLQLRPVQTSIGNLIRSVAAEYKQDLQERNLRLRIEMPDDLPYIEADAKRIYQVIDNLVVNAIKYTPDGGWIRIEGSRVGMSEGTEWVEVIVSDSGIGIDPEHLERIFEKFYQTGEVALHSTGKTKFKGGGPGLGLAIAKGIIEAHGGRVWAESEGHDEETCPGSRFHVILPVTSLARTAEIPSPFSYTRSPTGSSTDVLSP